MFRLITRASGHQHHIKTLSSRPRYSHTSSRTSDPLRILFCGSDGFSCESLRALHREYVRDKGLVEALDVMVLPGKRMGRGFKMVREVPCKTLAEELGLPIHQRETFRNWALPHGTNLIVVVSFGLFVPPRILQSAKYGGLNVHPSLLPEYVNPPNHTISTVLNLTRYEPDAKLNSLRGPAPIHHALLRGDTHMGISLQTLDHRAFDHGTILAQTPAPGIPIAPDASFQKVLSTAAVEGADMLIRGLREGVHIPPYRDVGWKAADLKGGQLHHAPKVTKADGQVHWSVWTAEQFSRRIRVLGSVWTYGVNDKGSRKRVIFLDAQPVEEGQVPQQLEGGKLVCECDEGAAKEAERHVMTVLVCDDASCLVKIHNGSWVRFEKVKVDGKPEQMATVGLKGFIK